MDVNQAADMIYGMIGHAKDRGLYPEIGWCGLTPSKDGSPASMEMQIKMPGYATNLDSQVFTITVTERGNTSTQEEESTVGSEEIWDLKEGMDSSSLFPASVTIRARFADNGYTYYAYAAPGEQSLLVNTTTMFRHNYRLRPKFVEGGLYWSVAHQAFYLYQGTTKLAVTFRRSSGSGAIASSASAMPEDAKQVQYPEGSSFTLEYRSPAPRAS